MFKVCKNCDFEWNTKDGQSCPACSQETNRAIEVDQVVFNSRKKWVQALALVMLISLIILLVLN